MYDGLTRVPTKVGRPELSSSPHSVRRSSEYIEQKHVRNGKVDTLI